MDPRLEPVIICVSFLLKARDVSEDVFDVCAFRIAKGLLSRLL